MTAVLNWLFFFFRISCEQSYVWVW